MNTPSRQTEMASGREWLATLPAPEGARVRYTPGPFAWEMMNGWVRKAHPGARIVERENPPLQQIIQPDRSEMAACTADWFIDLEKGGESLMMNWWTSPREPEFFWERVEDYDGGSRGGISIPDWMSNEEASPYLQRLVALMRDPSFNLGVIDPDGLASDVARFLGLVDRNRAIPSKAGVRVFERVRLMYEGESVELQPGEYETKVRSWNPDTGEVTRIEFHHWASGRSAAMDQTAWDRLIREAKMVVDFSADDD